MWSVSEEEKESFMTLSPGHFRSLSVRKPAWHLPARAQFRMSADVLLPLRHPIPHVGVLVDEAADHAAGRNKVKHRKQTWKSGKTMMT